MSGVSVSNFKQDFSNSSYNKITILYDINYNNSVTFNLYMGFIKC